MKKSVPLHQILNHERNRNFIYRYMPVKRVQGKGIAGEVSERHPGNTTGKPGEGIYCPPASPGDRRRFRYTARRCSSWQKTSITPGEECAPPGARSGRPGSNSLHGCRQKSKSSQGFAALWRRKNPPSRRRADWADSMAKAPQPMVPRLEKGKTTKMACPRTERSSTMPTS